jgi:hypothetical protein
MENKSITTSKKFSLNIRDFGKGLIISIGTAVLVVIQNSLADGSLEFNWEQIGVAAGGAAVAYLLKNFFSPATIKTPIE